jgi:hypothetical protein
MRLAKIVVCLVLPLPLSGCLMTKVVTIPMKVAGEVIGFVPVAGGVLEGAVDTAAAAIDMVPL